MQDQILDMLLKEDEITWQTILYDLIKSEKMDPWNIDISILTQKYIEIVKKLQETNFSLSGKVILASSILLKIKSDKLLSEKIVDFDNLLNPPEEIEEIEEIEQFEEQREIINPKLTIKTPQARKKKVSINDLVFALERALEVDERRKLRKIRQEHVPENLKISDRGIDIGVKIKEIYSKIKSFLKKQNQVTFTELLTSKEKQDVIYTFVPLLHLDNQRKIDMNQKEHFGEIDIKIK